MVEPSTWRTSAAIQVDRGQAAAPGQRVSFTVRPEKIRIDTDKPARHAEDLNILRGRRGRAHLLRASRPSSTSALPSGAVLQGHSSSTPTSRTRVPRSSGRTRSTSPGAPTTATSSRSSL
ncbi:MAG: hypothetical protein M0C28_43375 [Candidatus Moduliflexus flocculans]|nr:hypothetical protein [Candidatus Moduliflexus flocculans]